MNRLNFELVVFCIDHETETGLNLIARTLHHFFIKLDQNIHRVQIEVGTILNIPLLNRASSKVHGIDIKSLVWLHLLAQMPRKWSLHDFWVTFAVWDGPPYCRKIFWFWKVSVNKGRFFSATYSNKLACWLSCLRQWRPKETCSHLRQLQPKPS